MRLKAIVYATVGGIALASVHANAAHTTTGLAPVTTVLDGRNDLVGVAATSDGTIYVSDRSAGVVYRRSTLGVVSTPLAGLDGPAGLTFDSEARLLVAEERGGRILRLEPSGTLTVLATGLSSPQWIAPGTATRFPSPCSSLRPAYSSAPPCARSRSSLRFF